MQTKRMNDSRIRDKKVCNSKCEQSSTKNSQQYTRKHKKAKTLKKDENKIT